MELSLNSFLTVILTSLFLQVVKTSPVLETRQSALPAGWNSVGCFSDSTASRTLKTASFTDVTNMTIEACLAFCTTPTAYQFSGVEFSRECYCDNSIEAPGTPISSDACNMPCTGDADEICGGSGAISVFSSTVTAPPPTASIKTSVGPFQYKGCFQDGVNGAPRTLLNRLTVSAGVTAESCTAACKAAGFALAGLEFGQECWCDSYMEIVTLSPDSECNMPCQADATEICGAGNRLVVYQDLTASPPSAQACLPNSQINSVTFGLQAVPAQGGGTPHVLGAFELAAFKEAPSFFLLSNGGTGPPPIEAITFTLGANGIFSPTNFFGEGLPIPLAPIVGRIQVFAVPFNNPLVAYNKYCAMPNPISTFGPFIGPPVLAVNGHPDLWGLCPNITQAASVEDRVAGGRLDVVFNPIATNADYVLESCQSVVLQMQ